MDLHQDDIGRKLPPMAATFRASNQTSIHQFSNQSAAALPQPPSTQQRLPPSSWSSSALYQPASIHFPSDNLSTSLLSSSRYPPSSSQLPVAPHCSVAKAIHLYKPTNKSVSSPIRPFYLCNLFYDRHNVEASTFRSLRLQPV